MIIGHNLIFDISIIKVELLRLIRCEEISKEIKKKYTQDFYFIINYNKFYCTMKKSIELCNIIKYNATGKQYLKYPKLSELHKKLFDCEPNHLHNSYNDVLVTLRCFMKLKNDVDIYTNCIHYIMSINIRIPFIIQIEFICSFSRNFNWINIILIFFIIFSKYTYN